MLDRATAAHDQVGDDTEDGDRPHDPERTQRQSLPERTKSPVQLMQPAQRLLVRSQLPYARGAVPEPWPRCAGHSSRSRAVGRLGLTHWLVRNVLEGDNGVERVPVELQGCPAVAAVPAFPELAVGETGK